MESYWKNLYFQGILAFLGVVFGERFFFECYKAYLDGRSDTDPGNVDAPSIGAKQAETGPRQVGARRSTRRDRRGTSKSS